MAKLNDDIKQQFLIEFGKNVKKIRKQRKISQLELAIKINGDNNKISRIERGLYDFKLSSLLIIANVLEVELNELINLENINFFKNNIWQ